MIEIGGLHKSFKVKHAERLEVLKGIDLSIGKAETIVLIGPSGSGKSTLLRCINRLEKVDSGEILLNGKSVLDPKYKLATLRRQVGMVFQQFNLFPHLTALENVIIALVHVQKTPKREAIEAGRALLEKVGLGDKVNVRPGQLSGGQQQRVAIARALASGPEVIMFDEPTSALDPETIGEVLQVMRGVAAEGMTMLVVSHEMEFTRELADRVVIIDGGVIIEEGPPEQLMDNPQQERTRLFLRKLSTARTG